MKNRKMEIANKGAVLAVCGVFLLIVSVIGFTYAAFTVTGEGGTNTITTGTIVFSYSEPTNALVLDKTLPMSDLAGMASNQYFDFSVATRTSANMNIPYEISGTKISGTIDDSYIKLYLTYGNDTSVGGIFNSTAVAVDDLIGVLGIRNGESDFLIFRDSIDASSTSTSKYYRLRMWISDSYRLVSGVAGTYSLKINVDAAKAPLQ